MLDLSSTTTIYSYKSIPCPKCGVWVKENEICWNCGTWVVGEKKQEKIKYCPYCGKRLPESEE